MRRNIFGWNIFSSAVRERLGKNTRGATVLPGVIMATVGLVLLQVPMMFRSHSSEKFHGASRTAYSAQCLAEAGVAAAVADIGRNAILLGADGDTLAYTNSGLGRGSYSTRIRTRSTQPGIVEVLSTGRVGASSQSIRAQMAVVKTPATIPFETPRLSAWVFRGTPSALYFQSLSEKAAGLSWIHPEGILVSSHSDPIHPIGLAMAIDGSIYFVNSKPGSPCDLYRIPGSELDANPATPVHAMRIGSTGISSIGEDEIRSLTFSDRGAPSAVLLAASWMSRKVYALNVESGAATLVSELVPRGLIPSEPFKIRSLAAGPEGKLFALREGKVPELWQLESFPNRYGTHFDSIIFISKLPGLGKNPLIAGHPNGLLYAVDAAHWFQLNPKSATNTVRAHPLAEDSSDITGIGFFTGRESGQASDKFLTAMSGMELKLKVITWEAVPGDLASAR